MFFEGGKNELKFHHKIYAYTKNRYYSPVYIYIESNQSLKLKGYCKKRFNMQLHNLKLDQYG